MTKDTLCHKIHSNRQIVSLMNKFVSFSKKSQGEYPKSETELFDFLEQKGIDIDELPQPIDAHLIYNLERHRYEIEKPDREEI